MQVCAHRVRRMQVSKCVALLQFSSSVRCALAASQELIGALDLNWKGMFLVPLARHVNLIRFSVLSSELIRALGAQEAAVETQQYTCFPCTTETEHPFAMLHAKKTHSGPTAQEAAVETQQYSVRSVLLRLNTRLLCSMQRERDFRGRRKTRTHQSFGRLGSGG